MTQRRFKVTKNLARVGFSEESLQFLKLAGEQDEPTWLEENDAKYQQLIRAPLLALGETLKDALVVESNGYHFPIKGIGRIKKPANKVSLNGVSFKDWVSYIATRPSLSRFEKNPLLFFGLLPNDPEWKGVVVAGGLYMASSTQTRRIRQAIADDSKPFKKLFADKEFQKSFKTGFNPLMKGKACPRGFDADHPDIEWIKLKTFFVSKKLTMKELSSPELAANVVRDFRQLLRLNVLLDAAIDGDS